MRNLLTKTAAVIFLSAFVVGTISLWYISPSEAALTFGSKDQILPEITKAPTLYNLEKRNQVTQTSQNEDSSYSQDDFRLVYKMEGNSIVLTGVVFLGDPLLIHAVESAYRQIEQIKKQVKELAAANQKGKGGIAFRSEPESEEGGGDAGGGEGVSTADTLQIAQEAAMDTVQEIEPARNEQQDILTGDVDGNGIFDFNDAVLITQIAYGVRQGSKEELAKADLNGDGVVDKWDAFLGALVVSEVITLEQAKTATPQSLGLDSHGVYSRTDSSMDPQRGVLGITQLIVGELSMKDVEKRMKMLSKHLQHLMKMMADMMGADSVSDGAKGASKELAGYLSKLCYNFDRYVQTGYLPTY